MGSFVTAIGSNFPAGDSLAFGYTAGDCAAGFTFLAGVTGTADGHGHVAVAFQWPQVPVGIYYICVLDKKSLLSYSAMRAFRSLAADLPALTAPASVGSGQAITVRGRNFPPSPTGDSIEVLYGVAGTDGCAISVNVTTVAMDGTFAATFRAPHVSNDANIVITAVRPVGACGTDRVIAAAQTATFVQAPIAASGSNAENPLGLPTLVLQALFVFTTVSGLASLVRFTWDVIRGTVGGARGLRSSLRRAMNRRR